MKISDKTKLNLFFLAFFCLVGSISGHMLLDSKQKFIFFQNEMLEVKSELSETYILKEGVVESPSVIILLENKTAFFSKLKELEATTIYYEETYSKCSFYVFGYETDMLVAYRFTVLAWE